MAVNPNFQLSLTYRDFSDETANMSIYTADAVDISGVLPATVQNLVDAINGLANGTLDKLQSSTVAKRNATGNGTGKREWKILAFYRDAVTFRDYVVTIPCSRDLATMPNTDLVDITAGAGLTFKTAFEALARSIDGNAVVLNKLQITGRAT